MEYILFGYTWTILFHMSRNEMVSRFEIALSIEKQGLTPSLRGKRNYFPNNIIIITMIIQRNGCQLKYVNPCAGSSDRSCE